MQNNCSGEVLYGAVDTTEQGEGRTQKALQHILTWFPPALHVPSQTYASGSQHVLASPQLLLRLLIPAVLLQISVTQETMPPKCFLCRGKIEHYGTCIEHTVKKGKCDMRALGSCDRAS